MASQSPSWTTLLGMGASTAAIIAVGLVLGLVIDSLAGTGPVFLLIGLLVGIVGAVSFTVTQFRKYLKT